MSALHQRLRSVTLAVSICLVPIATQTIAQTPNAKSRAIVTHAGVIRSVITHRCNLFMQLAWELTKNHCCIFDFTLKELVTQ